MAKLLYTDGANWKTYFERPLPEHLKGKEAGNQITCQDLGYADSSEFCEEEVGNYNEEFDHNLIDIIEITSEDFIPLHPKTLPADAYPLLRGRTITHNGIEYTWDALNSNFKRSTEKQSRAVAARFNNLLKKLLSKAELEEIRTLNGTPDYQIPGPCPTHNYLDSNEIMHDAFKFIMQRNASPIFINEDGHESMDGEIINEAWRIARMSNYKN